MREDETWYVIASEWYNAYTAFTSNPSLPPPKPIDNFIISTPENTLKPDLTEGLDYMLVTQEQWSALKEQFGLVSPEFPRQVIRIGSGEDDLAVEVYLLQLNAHLFGTNRQVTISISRKAKLSDFFQLVCKKLGGANIDVSEHRFWTAVEGKPESCLNSGSDDDQSDKTLEEIGLAMNQEILVEESDELGYWPISDLKLSKSPSKLSMDANMHEIGDGLVGLVNLGNTCFMNSALQCLSHTISLTQYFLSDTHKKEINVTNPLGMGGAIASSYGSLVKSLWRRGSNGAIAPRDFKYTISRFASQFSGYRQHDSQELLGFLLDGLHEDLNRITKKPYVETKDHDGRPDAIVASEAWANHKLRNDSVIVDLFQGQFKSTLVCPKCNHISITFDPYMYLSLPLPVDNQRNLSLMFVYHHHKKSEMIALQLPSSILISDIKHELAKKTNVPVSNIIIARVYRGKILRLLSSWNALSLIAPHETLIAYECRSEEDIDDSWVTFEKKTGWGNENIAYPILLKLDAKTDKAQIKRAIVDAVFPWVTEYIPTDVKDAIAADDYSKFELHIDENIDERKGYSLVVPESVDMPTYAAGNDMETANSSRAKEGVSLYECVDLFTKEEKLSSQNSWYCPKCKEHVEAFKKFDIWSFPPILVVHLKRFSYRRYLHDKLNIFVDFPVTDFNVSPYALNGERAVYDLFAVSNHYGGLGGGHYTAYAKSGKTGTWNVFDDSSVSGNINENNVKSSSAYLLFYQKRKE